MPFRLKAWQRIDVDMVLNLLVLFDWFQTTGFLPCPYAFYAMHKYWLIQMEASQMSGKPVLPRLFWYMSMTGSICPLLYFVFGENDSVELLSNLFPFTIAVYNLSLDINHRKSLAGNQ